MTAAQMRRLSEVLVGTTNNVYAEAKRLFRLDDAGDAIFDRLAAETGIFRCEECSQWQSTDLADAVIKMFCVGCVNRINDADEPAEGADG